MLWATNRQSVLPVHRGFELIETRSIEPVVRHGSGFCRPISCLVLHVTTITALWTYIITARNERPIVPADLFLATFHHRWKVAVWTVLVAGISILALIVWPRKYESEAKLFLRLGRESVSLDPTATTGATIQVLESRENQLNSAREMLKSRVLLEQVVESIGAETILHGSPTERLPGVGVMFEEWGRSISSLFSTISSIGSPASVSADEKAIDKLSKSIHVSLAKNSSVISVECTARNSKLAQAIMQSFLEAYGKQHLSANRTSGSLKFFETQTSQCKHELDTAAEELRDVKNEFGLISIAAEKQAVQTQLTHAEDALMSAKASLASTEASTANLRKALTNIPETLTTQQTTGFANVAADHMQQEYFKLLISTNELLAKLGESHPLVKISRDHARELQQIVDKQSVDRTQTTIGVNPSRQSLELDLRREEALAASLLTKVAVLTDQYAVFQQRFGALNEHEVRITDLERRVAIAEAKYRNYADHLEQARIGDALEANLISNLNIVQPPSLVEKPVSPKPLILFGLTLVVIVVGNIVLVLGSEYLDHQFRRTEQGPIRSRRDDNTPWPRVPTSESVFAERSSQPPLKG